MMNHVVDTYTTVTNQCIISFHSYIANPYHNNLHAADVANSYIFLLKESQLYQCLADNERAAVRVTALSVLSG